MSASALDDSAMTSGSAVTSDVNRALRLNGAKTNSRYFRFPWKQRNKDEKKHTAKSTNDIDFGSENLSNTKLSNGFLMNIKKRLRIRNIDLCKTKQKVKTVDSQCPTGEATRRAANVERLSSAGTDDPMELDSRLALDESDASSGNEDDEIHRDAEADARREIHPALGDKSVEEGARSRDGKAEREFGAGSAEQIDCSYARGEEEEDSSVFEAESLTEPRSTVASESLQARGSVDAGSSDDSKAKANLSEELLKLSKYGWYWGPISGDEADSKLAGEPDGAFLVRDSSDDRYLLTLSFKSSGRLLHARMEHSGGLFSLCNQDGNEGFTSVAALIDHSMNSSQSAVFCYSRPRYPGYPSFPVRLTKPVSRFTQVRSLQYLCRFVIRQNTRLDNIHKLPLPKTIRGYIEEAHY